MHFKYVITLLLFIHLTQVSPALSEEKSVEQLIKDIEKKVDSGAAADLIKQIGNAQPSKQAADALDNINKNKVVLPLQKVSEGAIASERGIDSLKMLSRYQPKMDDVTSKPTKLNQLLIFISLSMPKDSLVSLHEQAKKAGGLLVLRGLVNNSFKETANVIHGLSSEGIDVTIDPRLFEAFAIEAVPTFIVLPTDSHPCADKACSFTPLHDKLTGNVSLEYALEYIAFGGKVSNAIAQNYLTKLRGKS